MTALTHRTDAELERRQDRKGISNNAHPEPYPGAFNPGQRRILSSRSMWKGFSYNKGALVRWNRSSQVVEGMRWNHYRSSGKSTPFFSHHSDHIPTTAHGLMKSYGDVKRERKIKDAGSDIFRPGARTKMEAHATHQTPLQNKSDVPDLTTRTHTNPLHPKVDGHEEPAGIAHMRYNQPGSAGPNPRPADENPGIFAEKPVLMCQPPEKRPRPASTKPQARSPPINPSAAILLPASSTQEREEAPSSRPGGNPQEIGDNPITIRIIEVVLPRLKTATVKRGTPTADMPISEGLMGMQPQGSQRSADYPAPPKAGGYVGSARRRMLMLKTANATADPE